MNVDIELCKTVLNKIYPESIVDVIEWKVEGFNKLIGFHGEHFILKITFKISEKEKELSFFVKAAPQNSLFFDYYKKIRCFEKEYYMLDEVLDELQSQIDEKLTAKCYVNQLNKMAIFEDLSAIGYKMTEKATDWEHVRISIEKLAVFHATTMIFEERSGCSISEKFPLICFETFVNHMDKDEGATFRSTFTVIKHLLFEKMDEIPFEDKTEFAEWVKIKGLEMVKPSEKYRNVINHGDPWIMNFMYKYTEEGEIEDVLLVDFQVCRIAPPAFELQLFLSLRYSYDELIANSPALLSIYYDALSRTLIKAGLEPSKILLMETLQESFDHYRCAGMITKSLYTVIVSIPEEYLQSVNTPEKFLKLMAVGDTELSCKAFENDQNYRDSCSQAINVLYKEYLITKQSL